MYNRFRFVDKSEVGEKRGSRNSRQGRHSLALRFARVADSTLDVAFAGGDSRDWDLAAADLLVHDGQYTDDEFADKSDWGHSTAAFAVHVAAEANVKRLLLSHHDPSHNDREIDRIISSARRLPEAKSIEDVSAAHESQSIDLGRA